MSNQTIKEIYTPQKKDLQASSTSASLRRRRLADLISRLIITSGGIAIILCILAILLFIAIEVIPLWKSVRTELVSSFIIEESPELSSFSLDYPVSNRAFPFLASGAEEYREIGFIIEKNGSIQFVSLKDGKIVKSLPLTSLQNRGITSVFVAVNNEIYVVGTDQGKIIPIRITYKVTFNDKGERTIDPLVTEEEPIQLSDTPLKTIAYESGSEEGSVVAAAVTSHDKLIFFSQEEKTSLLGDVEKLQILKELTAELNGRTITTMEIDSFLENLYIGTKQGTLFHWDIKDKENPSLVGQLDVTGDSQVSVTALAFLLGDRSLIVGDESGNVSVWFQLEDKSSTTGKSLKKVHVFDSLDLPITAISASPRNRGFVSADSGGNIMLYHATSNQTLLKINSSSKPIRTLSFSPKANGIVAVDDKGKLYNWKVDNPHPETTFKTLFGKVWYEGYAKPEYVWQSTGGTDDFEPKFSLTPLAFGTLKGSIYALFFAIPLSILGAICVSQFMHPSLRNTIKPIIEIMAALPSVVLGFFAGLWLAPYLEKIVPAVFMMPVVITILTLLSVFMWRLLPKSLRGKFADGSELFFLIPVIIIGVMISLWMNSPIENLLLGGDYKGWLYNILGLQYDQRNALIVGFAMGFAVIPIIFTISEDALSSVPRHLTAGSLALGATRWQTAINVILPTASAGIFSALMIGLGRAVGETMIVLMATGNTPVMDWSIFNGFRALSANIAVEIPEAPFGGTLYRVLFLAALLLFLVTFVLNTAAELVRQRLRKKFGQL